MPRHLLEATRKYLNSVGCVNAIFQSHRRVPLSRRTGGRGRATAQRGRYAQRNMHIQSATRSRVCRARPAVSRARIRLSPNNPDRNSLGFASCSQRWQAKHSKTRRTCLELQEGLRASRGPRKQSREAPTAASPQQHQAPHAARLQKLSSAAAAAAPAPV